LLLLVNPFPIEFLSMGERKQKKRLNDPMKKEKSNIPIGILKK
jgi:hypothetical protein